MDGHSRYRLIETVRQYAQDRLRECGETESLQDRHLAYFVRLAEEIEPNLTGDRQKTWLDRLEDEHDNLRAALAWSCAPSRDVVAGLRIAGVLWRSRRVWLPYGGP